MRIFLTIRTVPFYILILSFFPSVVKSARLMDFGVIKQSSQGLLLLENETAESDKGNTVILADAHDPFYPLAIEISQEENLSIINSISVRAPVRLSESGENHLSPYGLQIMAQPLTLDLYTVPMVIFMNWWMIEEREICVS